MGYWSLSLVVLYYTQRAVLHSFFSKVAVKKFFYGSAILAGINYFINFVVFFSFADSLNYIKYSFVYSGTIVFGLVGYFLIVLLFFFLLDFALTKFIFKSKTANALVLAAALCFFTGPLAMYVITIMSPISMLLPLAAILLFLAVVSSLLGERPAADKSTINKFAVVVAVLFFLGLAFLAVAPLFRTMDNLNCSSSDYKINVGDAPVLSSHPKVGQKDFAVILLFNNTDENITAVSCDDPPPTGVFLGNTNLSFGCKTEYGGGFFQITPDVFVEAGNWRSDSQITIKYVDSIGNPNSVVITCHPRINIYNE